jgi:hypothetical protein
MPKLLPLSHYYGEWRQRRLFWPLLCVKKKLALNPGEQAKYLQEANIYSARCWELSVKESLEDNHKRML